MAAAPAAQSVKYGQEVSFTSFLLSFWLLAAEKRNTHSAGLSQYVLRTLNGNRKCSLSIEYKILSGYLESCVNVC